MHLRQLTRAELKQLHRTVLRHAFPPTELKPFLAMDALLKQGVYDVLALSECDEDLSWALIWRSPDRSCALLDYLVTREDRRGEGLGACLLRELAPSYLPDIPILVEAEAPGSGDPAERRLQERRLAFYHRVGFADAGFNVILYTVHYRILALGSGPDLRTAYRNLYLGGPGRSFVEHHLRFLEGNP